MKFTETRLKGAFIIDLEPHRDERGFFARGFCQKEMQAHGVEPLIAQANFSYNKARGTLRGMHFQDARAPESKLVRCVRGSLLDTIIDLRPESPTFLQHVSVELTGDNSRALFVPPRFAHGFLTLEDETVATYQVGEFYTPGVEGGLRYDDPALGLSWPVPVEVISEKDTQWAGFSEQEAEIRARMRVEADRGPVRRKRTSTPNGSEARHDHR
ncbi:MAG: dTDP-4-dehydrorhamnose 3,5-epimerase [Rhodothermales bacterium]|nr:dTDP-4-dehydrorhamnose 3,5-epimerase [Rhodothermales bacterium]MBO6779564.1 dTDP-4-dehydrorhamnose 3,5-epimerase [Rhodothermales bacterium]